MALSAADFISRMDEVIAPLFTHVQFRKRDPRFIDFTTYAQQQATRRNERDTKHTPNYMERMKHKIDSPMGRHIYSKRLGTVEPVFGNLESNKGLKRFTLRGKEKVNAQWLLYCMVHNIEKIATQGSVRY